MTRLPAHLREQVRHRAGGRCEYCGRPERFTVKRHHVDHVMAIKHAGSTTLDNLAYACAFCNCNKGSDIAAFDEVSQRLAPLYNPRTQKWDRHFEMVEAVIIGKTATGRVTVRLLQMNDPKQVDIRRALIENELWN